MGATWSFHLEAGWVPIEIKHAARIRPDDTRGLEAFRELYGKQSGPGLLLSMDPEVAELKKGIFNLPIGLLLNGTGEQSSDR